MNITNRALLFLFDELHRAIVEAEDARLRIIDLPLHQVKVLKTLLADLVNQAYDHKLDLDNSVYITLIPAIKNQDVISNVVELPLKKKGETE